MYIYICMYRYLYIETIESERQGERERDRLSVRFCRLIGLYRGITTVYSFGFVRCYDCTGTEDQGSSDLRLRGLDMAFTYIKNLPYLGFYPAYEEV